jgi:hypothetical protein
MFAKGSYRATEGPTETASKEPSGDQDACEGISARKEKVERATQDSEHGSQFQRFIEWDVAHLQFVHLSASLSEFSKS